jgi:hypothetical protein
MRGLAGEARRAVKAGEMAIVSRCMNPDHIGMIVRVIGRHETPDFDWDVELLGAPVRGYSARTGDVGVFRYAAVFDWNLSPLEGSAHSCQVAEREIALAT